LLIKEFVIRNVRDGEEEKLEKFGFVLKMLFLYHGDLDKRNMFLAVKDEEVVAVAHLMLHDTFDAEGHDEDQGFVRYLTSEINFADQDEDEEIKDALLDAMIVRAKEIKAQHPEKRIVIAQYTDTDDLPELSYYLKRGFTVYDTIAVFKYDLSRVIPQYPLPEGVQIRPYVLDNNEAREQYHQAELASFDGVAWSMNQLAWMQGAEEMKNFCAFSGDQFLGNTSTWKIAEGHSATENVFVIPEWQKQGIARNLLCTALEYLKDQGKTIATLGTHGTNKKAIRLYTQIGYELDRFRLTLGYAID
jgi:ribosomal protein S18 acetylase RimI-like enzyme